MDAMVYPLDMLSIVLVVSESTFDHKRFWARLSLGQPLKDLRLYFWWQDWAYARLDFSKTQAISCH
jgi:hypothetical protein